MYAFHHKNVVWLEPHPVSVVFLVAFHEVELRELHLLACEQGVELAVEQLHVHRPETFEILLAVLIQRGLFPFDEIIVQFYDLGVEPQYPALLGDAQGG